MLQKVLIAGLVVLIALVAAALVLQQGVQPSVSVDAHAYAMRTKHVGVPHSGYCKKGKRSLDGWTCCDNRCKKCGGEDCLNNPSMDAVCCANQISEKCKNKNQVSCVVPSEHDVVF